MPTATMQFGGQIALSVPAIDQLGFGLRSSVTHKTIESALRSIFPEAAEETKLHKARQVLKDVAAEVTDDELEIFLTKLQCIADSWFDVFEQGIFDGLTLHQVLREA